MKNKKSFLSVLLAAAIVITSIFSGSITFAKEAGPSEGFLLSEDTQTENEEPLSTTAPAVEGSTTATTAATAGNVSTSISIVTSIVPIESIVTVTSIVPVESAVTSIIPVTSIVTVTQIVTILLTVPPAESTAETTDTTLTEITETSLSETSDVSETTETTLTEMTETSSTEITETSFTSDISEAAGTTLTEMTETTAPPSLTTVIAERFGLIEISSLPDKHHYKTGERLYLGGLKVNLKLYPGGATYDPDYHYYILENVSPFDYPDIFSVDTSDFDPDYDGTYTVKVSCTDTAQALYRVQNEASFELTVGDGIGTTTTVPDITTETTLTETTSAVPVTTMSDSETTSTSGYEGYEIIHTDVICKAFAENIRIEKPGINADMNLSLDNPKSAADVVINLPIGITLEDVYGNGAEKTGDNSFKMTGEATLSLYIPEEVTEGRYMVSISITQSYREYTENVITENNCIYKVSGGKITIGNAYSEEYTSAENKSTTTTTTTYITTTGSSADTAGTTTTPAVGENDTKTVSLPVFITFGDIAAQESTISNYTVPFEIKGAYNNDWSDFLAVLSIKAPKGVTVLALKNERDENLVEKNGRYIIDCQKGYADIEVSDSVAAGDYKLIFDAAASGTTVTENDVDFNINYTVSCSGGAVAVQKKVVKGDANGDGTLNVRDAAFIAYNLAKNTMELVFSDGDFNGDGAVNVRDAAAIANHLAISQTVTDPAVTTTVSTQDGSETTSETTQTTVTTEAVTTQMVAG